MHLPEYFPSKNRGENAITHFVKDFLLVVLLSALLRTEAQEIDTTIPLVTDFQKIGDGPEKLFVYSAYFDEFGGSDRGSVRIIGGIKSIFPRPLYCKFFNNDGQHYSTIEAEVSGINDNNYLEYSATFITCRVMDFYTLPSFVSVVETATYTQNLTDILRVKYPEERTREEKTKFSVCVKPIFNYDRHLEFVEWMEFYRLMGVEKFTFYNVSIGPETSCLMSTYGDQVEILPWSSPYNYRRQPVIYMYGQHIASQDCLYRNRGVSEYMIYVDLDEMIVPRYGKNYSEFFGFLERELRHSHDSKRDIASFNFRNGFFFDQWEGDKSLHKLKIDGNPEADDIIRQLQISKKTQRCKYTHPNDNRSKFVVVPEKAIEIGSHSVFKTVAGTIRIAVPEELAYSHHYRRDFLDCFREPREKIVERSAQRFAEEVALQVADRLHSKGKHCLLFSAADIDDSDVVNEVLVEDNSGELEGTKLPSQNSMHDSLNSTISDWPLNNLLPNLENAVTEDQQYPSFDKTMLANVANPMPSMSTAGVNPAKSSPGEQSSAVESFPGGQKTE